MAIKESALTAITSITNSDFVRTVLSGGGSRRISVANLAKHIVENYAGSTLGGTARSIKSAIDALTTRTARLTTITATYVSNDYCGEMEVKRINTLRLMQTVGIIRMNLNLNNSMPTGTADVVIGNLGVTLTGDYIQAIPPQTNSRGTLLVTINATGVIKISNYSGVANQGFYRGNLAVELAV